MIIEEVKKFRLTNEDTKLIEYIEKTRGIPTYIASKFLIRYQIKIKQYGVPVARRYNFVGIDGASIVNSYYEKMHTVNIDRDNMMPLVIGNASSTTCFFFESQWDFMAFLTLVEMDWTHLVAKFKFMIFSNTTKNALTVAKSSNKIEKVMMLHRNKRFLNNAKKIFGDIVVDKSDNYINEFGSLSNKVRGIMI